LIHTYEKEIGVHSKRKVLTARARFPLGSHNKDNNFLWANKQTTQTSFGGAIVRLVSNTNNFLLWQCKQIVDGRAKMGMVDTVRRSH